MIRKKYVQRKKCNQHQLVRFSKYLQLTFEYSCVNLQIYWKINENEMKGGLPMRIVSNINQQTITSIGNLKSYFI